MVFKRILQEEVCTGFKGLRIGSSVDLVNIVRSHEAKLSI
jgi:hypothetical protein